MDPNEKVCPFCAETIKAAAIKCRYCGSDLPKANIGDFDLEEQKPGASEEHKAFLDTIKAQSTPPDEVGIPRFYTGSIDSAVDKSVPYPASTPARRTSDPQAFRPNHNGMHIAWAVGTFATLLFVITMCKHAEDSVSPSSPLSTPTSAPVVERDETQDKINAALMAEEFVTRQLKSPGSAQYPDSWKMDVEILPNNTYRVRSYVDSQNGFGALLRSNFVVKLHQVGENWYQDAIDIQSQ